MDDMTTLSSTFTPSIALVFTASSVSARATTSMSCGALSAFLRDLNADANAFSSSRKTARLQDAFGHPVCCQL